MIYTIYFISVILYSSLIFYGKFFIYSYFMISVIYYLKSYLPHPLRHLLQPDGDTVSL